MDLASFESRKHADEGVEFPLVNIVAGAPVIGRDGEVVKFRLGHWDAPRIRAAVLARRKEREAKKEPTPAAVFADTEEQREREAADDLAAMTTGWTDNFDLDGQPCAFSQEKAAEVYFRFPEILRQMNLNARERANFLLGLAKT